MDDPNLLSWSDMYRSMHIKGLDSGHASEAPPMPKLDMDHGKDGIEEKERQS